MPLVGGVDLAGSPRRPTGYVVIDAKTRRIVRACVLYTDDEIVSSLVSDGVELVAVDAPLTEPHQGGYRSVDRELIKRGFRVLPPSWPGMRVLTRRALRIKSRLEVLGIRVVETHPRSAWLSSRCSTPLEAVCRLVDCSLLSNSARVKDVVDAAVAAAVALSVLEGSSVVVQADDGEVHLLPQVCEGSAI